MSKMWITLLCIIFLFNSVRTVGGENKEEKQVTCTGKVIDEQDRPIAGVMVTLFEMVYDYATAMYDPKVLSEVQIGTDGVFSFDETIKENQYRSGQIVAEKEGLALGFDNWNMRDGDKTLEITLGPPKEISGTVVDEKGEPVSDARVAISFLVLGEGRQRKNLTGLAVPKLLATNTDEAGTFTFTRIPAGATAEFIAEKSGLATIHTYKRTGEAYQKLNFTEGQKDIKLVLPVEAKIEGVVVEKSTGKPVGGVKIRYAGGQEYGYYRPASLVSKEDGTFGIDALVSARYVLELFPPRDRLPDWVAERVEVVTEAGKIKNNVKIELSKGGVLEVKVTDAVNKEPVKEVSIGLRHQISGRYQSSRSDDGGIVRMRLMPGDYQVYNVYKDGYSRQRVQDVVAIEDGKTQHLEYELIGVPKITGIVRNQEGKPIEGAALQVCPMGNDACTSDADGKFEAVFDPGGWPSSRVPTMFLIGTHGQRNLAGAVQMAEDTRVLDLDLEPAVTLCGRVVDQNDRGIADAQVRVWMRGPTWGSTLRMHAPVRTNEGGGFEFKAIPPGHKYTFYVRAEGYGENPRDDFSTANIEGDRLDVGKLTLAIANLSVSGIVVDDGDKPVAGASIYGSGEGQSNCRTQTDTEGKFTLENVCAGKIRINANKSGTAHLYGSVETEGGAKDIRITIRERSISTRYEPRRPLSLVGRPLPELKDLNVNPSPGEMEEKVVLVCFWDMEQRPSRHCMTQLAKKAETLKNKNVVVVAVQASQIDQNTLDGWVKKYKIPFPVGMIQSNSEKVRFSWGVRSLPWLILADKDHVVIAEGFALSKLDDKIAQNAAGK
jgi:protocatechuate 3,4-dioxygenase beta subunit